MLQITTHLKGKCTMEAHRLAECACLPFRAVNPALICFCSKETICIHMLMTVGAGQCMQVLANLTLPDIAKEDKWRLSHLPSSVHHHEGAPAVGSLLEDVPCAD